MLEEQICKVEARQNLTESEAESVLKAILEETVDDEEIRKILIALSEKGESVEEITGFARVMRQLAVSIKTRHEVFVDTAGTGGGTPTFNVSTAAAFVIAAAGVPVAKHGNRAITSKSGSADVLAELGVDVGCSRELSEQALDEIGICFMFAPHFHPAMKRVAKIRQELGRRTIFNMLGPLTNPASAPCQVIGVYSEELLEKLAYSLVRLGCRKAWVVHGYDGLDEISIASKTRVAEVDGSDVRTFDFRPIGPYFRVPEGGTPAENARLIKAIFDGTVTGPARDIVVLNAAVPIRLAQGIGMTAALDMAEDAVTSGAAIQKLEQLKEITNR